MLILTPNRSLICWTICVALTEYKIALDLVILCLHIYWCANNYLCKRLNEASRLCF